VRRVAGVVRDMDVLTGKATDVDVDGERNCRIQLLQHLGVERSRAAHRLKRRLQDEGKAMRSVLKKAERVARRVLEQDRGDQQTTAATRALEISAQLRRFATMNRRNLHEFRKEAKQLRYVLQMANPRDDRLLAGLREMQDAIGEWHDWEELVAIATEALQHGRSCGLLRELRLHAESSFDEALRVANRIRRELLGSRGGPAPLRIVQATAKIAA
jgi:CHAD domain-containing protein